MTSFPVFTHLTVDGYDLYPGRPPGSGLDLELDAGLTLVLGANGLGKTTLVTMLYRLCTGPSDIPGLASGGDLGDRSVEARTLQRVDRRVFAARVVDNAVDAHATLTVRVGAATLSISRSLDTLTLTQLELDGETLPPSETEFQRIILKNAGVASFGDWILLLRHLIFYFEERRALVWDPSAQRQILRLLFVPPDVSTEWKRREREILALDSEMRNLQAVVSRQEYALARTEHASGNAESVRAEVNALGELQKVDEDRLDELSEELANAESQRQNARLEALQAELAHESSFRDLERRQLTAIAAAFPSANETARYLLSQLFTDAECLACGQEARSAEQLLRQRATDGLCLVCGSRLASIGSTTPSATSRGINQATTALEHAESRLISAQAERAQSEADYEKALTDLQRLTAVVAERRAKIGSLLRQLPPDDVAVHDKRTELSSLRGVIETQKAQLLDLRSSFSAYIRGVNQGIVRQRSAIKKAFELFAEGFLVEECNLVWAPHRTRVGQSGEMVEFASFELEMTGASFESPIRRHGPEQVSESQREFIDLAFRMALMAVGQREPGSTLVIDAPESSLDAVFVSRAAAVLTRFCEPTSENRLIVTSNLIEGDLIPELIRLAGIRSDRDKRVVDLLKVAAPTAATAKLGGEYAGVRRRLFQRAKAGTK